MAVCGWVALVVSLALLITISRVTTRVMARGINL